MKMMGLGGTALMMGSGAVTQAKASSTAKGKILIVGGGLAGVATSALLMRTLENADITIIEPNPKSVSYQPGQTLIGSGLWTKDDITYETADFMPDGVKWIKEKAVEFDPEKNSVKTDKGQVISYDYLVVAAGLKLDFARIEGLGITQTITSMGDNSDVRKVVGKNGIASIYFADGATDTWTQMQEFIEKAKSGKKVKGLFTDPNTPIKCGGAPKKIMYLTDARLREAGARANAELTLYPNGGKLFGIKAYNEAMIKQFATRDMKYQFKHNLIGVDPAKKIAIFDHHGLKKGAWDPDLEEYEMIPTSTKVEVPYDFLHITPPQKAPEEIGSSPIGSGKGWVPVNQETLQHEKYPNIFALGDIAAVPKGKTGGSARKQYKVVVENLVAVMEGKKELPAKYSGYTVCPLITGLGTVMLAEFGYGDEPTPSFPLDPTQERWIWWMMKLYLLKPMTVYGMLSGRA
ncbi:MAG: NAD(P)/FAD-dependent oxidoreductase [Epsilonproteobacteria bacterium]|nr:NAD(P)/FAD-dependent oxidoreductase [Campylobacterota bacterium]